jgi:alpha-L-fucosidase 2
MRRRMFLRNTAIAASAASALELLFPFAAKGMSFQNPTPGADTTPGLPGTAPKELRSAEYLRRVREEERLPGPPLFAGSRLSPAVQITAMPLEERLRRNLVPKHGFCSIAPGATLSEGLIAGNGAMQIEMTGDPYAERVLFHHERLLMPWKRPLEAPQVAGIFPQVRQMVLEGKYREAIEFAFKEMEKGPIKVNTWPHPTIPAFLMHLDVPKTTRVRDYLRTVDFERSEIRVSWSDEHGDWLCRTVTSRPDNVVVQLLTAPQGASVNVTITLEKSAGMRFRGEESPSKIQQDVDTDRMVYRCILDPSTDNSGYAGYVRVVRTGGSARTENHALIIENASSVMLLTRIEWFADYSEDKVEALQRAVESLTPDYSAILERHRKVQSEALNRVTVDFGGETQLGMSSEELLADQRSRTDYSPALLQKIFEMGRYWFLLTSGTYPTMVAEVNANINLQISPGPQGDLREGMDAYFHWMESLAPDFRVNARNIFGMRGTHYNLWPDKGMGVVFHYSRADSTGEIWPHPYWISAGGWCCRAFWDHYLVTGDIEFLRTRIVPALRELALFYEDFLTVTDKDGKYIFVPSFSPENNPGNLDPSRMLVINASMDIAVCREVLGNLIQASELLGIDADDVAKWKSMLEKLPPYLLEPDGTLKEWAWPTLQERYSHRHISHLYGAWPGDEIDPDRTPQLARGALMADRRRVPERLAAHGRCHRALVGARLKDCFLVDTELRQLIEQGYVGTTLRCSHDPYAWPMPDAQGGIQTIIMEMLAYSRPGEIELLPALPPSLVKGKIRGMLARTFARIDELAWDMEARTVNVTITSVKKQDVTLIARYGIEEFSAPAGVLAAPFQPETANCDLHLPEKKPVELHLKIGHHQPLEWVDQVM